MKANQGHAVIESTANHFMIVGGEQVDTEKCIIRNQQVTCSYFNTVTELASVKFYPELFLVPDKFCFPQSPNS